MTACIDKITLKDQHMVTLVMNEKSLIYFVLYRVEPQCYNTEFQWRHNTKDAQVI